jgi:hypothetical protein
MASISELSGKLVFKLNSGEIKNGRAYYRNLTLSGVKGSAGAEDLATVAGAVENLVQFPVEGITLTRVNLLTY